MITDGQRSVAKFLIEELDQLKLHVAKIPNRHGYTREVMCPNPDWYSRICRAWVTSRKNKRWKKPRTDIKRFFIRQTLKLIADGFNPVGKYSESCIDAIDWVVKTRGETLVPPPLFK